MPPRGSPHWGTDARPVLALRVELCSPRLFASRACGCASVCSVAFGLGSGQQGQSIECTPLASRAPSRERALLALLTALFEPIRPRKRATELFRLCEPLVAHDLSVADPEVNFDAHGRGHFRPSP